MGLRDVDTRGKELQRILLVMLMIMLRMLLKIKRQMKKKEIEMLFCLVFSCYVFFDSCEVIFLYVLLNSSFSCCSYLKLPVL